MTDEIKEINIKIPGQILDYVDTKEHLLELFNYITNLQQELKEANDSVEWWTNRFKAVQQENEKLKDILRVDDLIPPVDENMYKIWTQTIKNQNKINEICDYLKSKGDE